MALQKQIVDIPLGVGVDTKSDPKLLPPGGKAVEIINGRYTKTGELTKRNGYALKSIAVDWTGVDMASIRRVFAIEERLYAIASDTLYTWSESQGQFFTQNEIGEAQVTRQVFHRSPKLDNDVDCGYLSTPADAIVCAWTERTSATDSRVASRIIDACNGTVLVDTPILNTSAAKQDAPSVPRVIVVGDRCFVFYLTGGRAGVNICARYIDGADLDTGWSVEAVLWTDVSPLTPRFDICQSGGDVYVGMVYTHDGIDATRFVRYTTGLVQVAVKQLSPTADVSCLSVAAYGDTFWGVAATLTHVGGWVGNANLVEQVASANIWATDIVHQNISATALSATRCIVLCDGVRTANNSPRVDWHGISDLMAEDATSGHQHNVRLLGRPAYVDSSWYVLLGVLGGQDNNAICLMDLDIASNPLPSYHRRMVSLSCPGDAPTSRTGTTWGSLATLPARSTSELLAAQMVFGGDATVLNQGVDLLRWSFDRERQALAVVANGQAVVTGGVPQIIDQNLASEIAFAIGPETPTATIADGGNLTGATGGVDGADYYYRWCFEYLHEDGHMVVSQPSIAKKVTASDTAGHKSADLTVHYLSATQRPRWTPSSAPRTYPRVYIVPYRTEANGSIFYRLGPAGYFDPSWENNPDGDVYSGYNDTLADGVPGPSPTGLSANPILYTDTGLLPYQSVPSTTHVCVHLQRLWMIGEDRRTIYFSRKMMRTEVPAFHRTVLSTRIDEGGDITALASLGDKLLAFKADRVFVLFGDGPNDAGGESTLSDPVCVSQDSGTTEPRSVIRGPGGVWWFDGARICRMGQDLQVDFVGRDVETYLRTYTEVTSVSWDEAKGILAFTAVATAKTLGITLVFDAIHGIWSIDSVSDSRGVGMPVSTSIVWRGYHILCRHIGSGSASLLYQSTSSYLDPSAAWVTLSIETSPIRLGTIAGEQRVWNVLPLGRSGTPAGVRLEVLNDDVSVYDFTANVVTNGTFAGDTDWTRGAGWSIAGLVATKAAGVASSMSQSCLIVGYTYDITYTVTARTAGGVTLYAGTTAGTERVTAGAATTERIMCQGTTSLSFSCDAAAALSIDTVVARVVCVPQKCELHAWTDVQVTAAVGAASMSTVVVLQAGVVNQMCRSLRVRLSDTVPTTGTVGTGQGISFSNLTVELAGYTGAVRTAPGQRG
jgi:hypothetical protein